MPQTCRVDITGGTPQVINPVGTIIAQITPAANVAVRILNIEIQSNQYNPPQNLPMSPGSPTVEQAIFLQWGIYAAFPSSSGGLQPLAVPTDEVLQGLYSPSTLFRTVTTNLGGGFAPSRGFIWNTTRNFSSCWDSASGSDSPNSSRRSLDGGAYGQAVKAPAVYALIMPGAYIPPLQQPFNITGYIEFSEDH
jgi:hypothetical protein